jgi:hypothetical protein
VPARLTFECGRLNETSYYTFEGEITCYYGSLPSKSPRRRGQRRVQGEQPHHLQLELFPKVRHRWSWVKSDSKKELPEECIGKWERMYSKINKTLLEWKEDTEFENLLKLPLKEERVSKMLDSCGDYGLHYGLHDVVSWDKSENKRKEKEPRSLRKSEAEASRSLLLSISRLFTTSFVVAKKREEPPGRAAVLYNT